MSASRARQQRGRFQEKTQLQAVVMIQKKNALQGYKISFEKFEVVHRSYQQLV